MDSNLNWIGDNKIELEPNEEFAFLTKNIRTDVVGLIPKGSLVIYRYEDRTIKIKLSRVNLDLSKGYSLWIQIDVVPSDVTYPEWKKIK